MKKNRKKTDNTSSIQSFFADTSKWKSRRSLENFKPGGATAMSRNLTSSRVVLFEKLLKGQKMLIKEFQDLKREVLKLKEELERLKEELLTARVEELRQMAH